MKNWNKWNVCSGRRCPLPRHEKEPLISIHTNLTGIYMCGEQNLSAFYKRIAIAK